MKSTDSEFALGGGPVREVLEHRPKDGFDDWLISEESVGGVRLVTRRSDGALIEMTREDLQARHRLKRHVVGQYEPPSIGEMIYGCGCSSACGRVAAVKEHITSDSMDYWFVVEGHRLATRRARREPDGLLYEVTIERDYSAA